jgi:hypothetical protein
MLNQDSLSLGIPDRIGLEHHQRQGDAPTIAGNGG